MGVTGASVGFADFYAASRPRLLRVLVTAAADLTDAEDALQEAMVRAADRWDRVRRYDDPEAFVRRVALNLLSDGRKRRRRRDAAYRRIDQSAEAPAVDATTVLVVQAVRALSPEQRQAVALHYLLDMPVEQVAAELGRSINTVKTQLARGRARLAEALREEAEHGCGR
jgi:RNA polymerase sigma-70 factor (ECF subfamily)